MTALLLGAGFSKWAASLPLTADLFDLHVQTDTVRDRRWLAEVATMWEEWRVREARPDPERFIADVLGAATETPRRRVLWYIGRRLSEPYIWREWHAGRLRRHVLMIDEERKNARDGVREARRFLLSIGPGLSGILTTNYDMLVEYALGTKGFNYGHPGEVLFGRGPYPVSTWHNPVRLRGRLPIAKLHGSISWDAYGHYSDGRRAITGNALIVAPTPDKSPPADLLHVWELARTILSAATELTVFGFGFNQYDEALTSALSTWGRDLKEVLLVDVNPQPETARRLWPQAKVESVHPARLATRRATASATH